MVETIWNGIVNTIIKFNFIPPPIFYCIGVTIPLTSSQYPIDFGSISYWPLTISHWPLVNILLTSGQYLIELWSISHWPLVNMFWTLGSILLTSGQYRMTSAQYPIDLWLISSGQHYILMTSSIFYWPLVNPINFWSVSYGRVNILLTCQYTIDGSICYWPLVNIPGSYINWHPIDLWSIPTCPLVNILLSSGQ